MLSNDVSLRHVAMRRQRRPSHHAAWQKAADRYPGCTLDGPNHGPPRPVRHRDDGIIGHVDPLAVEPDAVMTVLGFPVNVRNGRTISVRAAEPLAAPQAVEPGFERGLGVAAIISGRGTSGKHNGRDDQCRDGFETVHASPVHMIRSLACNPATTASRSFAQTGAATSPAIKHTMMDASLFTDASVEKARPHRSCQADAVNAPAWLPLPAFNKTPQEDVGCMTGKFNPSAWRRHQPRRPRCHSPWRRHGTTTSPCGGRSSACDTRRCRRASRVFGTCTCQW